MALHVVSDRVIVLVKYLIAFKKRSAHVHVNRNVMPVGGFMTVQYHNKGTTTA